MKVAVIGSGIAGLVAARLLDAEHDVVLFEADDRVGGHAHTVDVDLEGERHPVDTGFIVHCERSYPTFVRLLDELGVATKPTDMSFGVRCESTGLEYASQSLGSLFAQRRNLFSPKFHRMVREVLRFFREAPLLLDQAADPTVGEWLDAGGYSRAFVEQHLVPLASSIWSAPPDALRAFPARFLVQFFQRQGFLSVNRRHPWRTLVGGSRSYVRPLVAALRGAVRTSCPVHSVRRRSDGVEIVSAAGPERFDHVVLACHADQALGLLADPSDAERAVLGALPYQRNEAVLHWDERLLPRRRRAWAAWNYHLSSASAGHAALTYSMNRLQGVPTQSQVLVTLNRTEAIRPERILRRFTYHHPVFTQEGVAAQRRHGEVSGVRRTHYCGAYWGYGFHEDGAASAVEAVRLLRQGGVREELAVRGLGAAPTA